MAYSPLYNTHVEIDSFRGIYQDGDGYNQNMRLAREMENVNISGGSFQPMREGVRIEQTLTSPIGTLAYLHRRFGQDTGTLLVAVSDGAVYTKLLDADDDWVERYTGLSVNDCDWITYEVSTYALYSDAKTYQLGERCTILSDPADEYSDRIPYRCTVAIDTAEAWNPDHWEEITQTDPVDILLFSNATDGMYCLYGDTLDVAPVETPKRFGVLARYNERIWGSGITGDPDMLVYSAPYDPFDWEAQIEIPEDGAGDIQVPTWDGDSFQALRQYGSDLIAIKRNSIWRIYGTNPGEFTVQRQYGGGSLVENTVAVHNGYAYMLGQYGLLRYDGSGAYAFQQEAVRDIMQEKVQHKVSALQYNPNHTYAIGTVCIHEDVPYRCVVSINTAEEWTPAHWQAIPGDPVNNACAGMWNGVYCLAIPLNGSANNNAILQYDTATGAFSLRTEVSVDSFLQINERLFYTSADYPGVVYEMDDQKGNVKFSKWISGYQDLGLKSSIKSAFTLYMMVESEVPIPLRLGIRTEKKLKQKIITTKPGKLTRVHLNNQGREFRLEIESYTAAPFTIAGGIKLDLELDPD